MILYLPCVRLTFGPITNAAPGRWRIGVVPSVTVSVSHTEMHIATRSSNGTPAMGVDGEFSVVSGRLPLRCLCFECLKGQHEREELPETLLFLYKFKTRISYSLR